MTDSNRKSQTAKIIVESSVPENEKDIPIPWDWAGKDKWCWGIASSPIRNKSHLEYLKNKGLIPVITPFLAHPETRKRYYEDNNRDIPKTEEFLKGYFDVFGNNFVWEGFTEEDSSGVGFSRNFLENPPRSHGEALKRFEKFLRKGLAEIQKYAPDIHKWGRCGYASSAHIYAKLGLEAVLLERTNDDIEDIQTGIAFTRGAGKQYNCSWGIDFSLWWGVFYGCVQDLSTSFHQRNWMVSYFSGAEYLAIEGGDLLCYPDGRLSRLGKDFEQFSRWIQKIPRGTPVVPVAVILPSDHGWITPPYWETQQSAWNYARLRRNPGERGIDGFFATIFPGSNFAMDPFPFGNYEDNDPPASPFALSCITPRYAPLPQNVFYSKAYIPFGKFKNRKEANQFLRENNIDLSPYRPMGVSRWGDIFDVFTEEVGVDVLKSYKVVVILGPLVLHEELKQKLIEYLRDGGTVVCSAGVIRPEDHEWCGVQMFPELHTGYRWKWQKGEWNNDAFRFIPANVDSNSEVIVWANQNAPLIVHTQRGKGNLYISLAPWFETGSGVLMGAVVHLLDSLFTGLVPFMISGPPCEWLLTEDDEYQKIVIINHADFLWEGSIKYKNTHFVRKEVIELVQGNQYFFDEGGKIDISIPPFTTKVFQFKKDKIRI